MTIDDALTHMFKCQITGAMPSKHVMNRAGYAAWIGGLKELGLQCGWPVPTSMHGDQERVASRVTAETLMVRGVDPEQILALYVLCFGMGE